MLYAAVTPTSLDVIVWLTRARVAYSCSTRLFCAARDCCCLSTSSGLFHRLMSLSHRSVQKSRAESCPPTTSYSLVTKQAVTRGLLTKWDIPTLLLTGTSGSGSCVVVVLWLPAKNEPQPLSPQKSSRTVLRSLQQVCCSLFVVSACGTNLHRLFHIRVSLLFQQQTFQTLTA